MFWLDRLLLELHRCSNVVCFHLVVFGITGSLRAGSVFEDDTARDAIAAYNAARAAPGAPAM